MSLTLPCSLTPTLTLTTPTLTLVRGRGRGLAPAVLPTRAFPYSSHREQAPRPRPRLHHAPRPYPLIARRALNRGPLLLPPPLPPHPPSRIYRGEGLGVLLRILVWNAYVSCMHGGVVPARLPLPGLLGVVAWIR